MHRIQFNFKKDNFWFDKIFLNISVTYQHLSISKYSVKTNCGLDNVNKAKSTRDLKDLEILPRFPLLTSKQKEDKNKINSFTR